MGNKRKAATCIGCGRPTSTRSGSDPMCAPCFAQGMMRGYDPDDFEGVANVGEFIAVAESAGLALG